MFQQSSLDSGWCLFSVHRQSCGYCRYATETGRQPCHGAEAVSLGLFFRTLRFPSLQSIDQVFDVPVAQVQQILRCCLCEDSRDPTVAARILLDNKVVVIPVVAQMQIPLVRFPQCFSICSTLIRWSTFVVQVLQFSSADVEETVAPR